MSTIKERISQIIDYKGMNAYSFEKYCELANGYIKSINVDVGSTKLERILRKLPEISPDWLILGEGEMLRKDDTCNYQSAQGVDISQTMINGRPDVVTLVDQLRMKDEQIRHLQSQAAKLTEMLHYSLGMANAVK